MNKGIIIVVAIVIAAFPAVIAYYIGRALERSSIQGKYADEHNKYLREIVSRDEKLEQLANRVTGLTEFNSRYLACCNNLFKTQCSI